MSWSSLPAQGLTPHWPGLSHGQAGCSPEVHLGRDPGEPSRSGKWDAWLNGHDYAYATATLTLATFSGLNAGGAPMGPGRWLTRLRLVSGRRASSRWKVVCIWRGQLSTLMVWVGFYRNHASFGRAHTGS